MRWTGPRFCGYERRERVRPRQPCQKIMAEVIDSGANTKNMRAAHRTPCSFDAGGRGGNERDHPPYGLELSSCDIGLSLSFRLCSLLLPAVRGQPRAEEAKNDVKGLFLLTDYPAVTLRPGTTSSVSLKLQNYGLPPERLALSVAGVPQGWTVTLVGGGQPVAAALPATNASVPLELRLDVPKDAPVGTTNLTVNAQGAIDQREPADRGDARHQSAGQADAQPAASRTARQLEVELRVHARASRTTAARRSRSRSRRPRRRISTPPSPSSTAARSSTRCRSTPASRRTSSSRSSRRTRSRPASTTSSAKVSAEDATATSDLVVDITGQPKIDISGREGLLSARASAGVETSIPVILTNSGTAPAEQVELSGSAPSGWKLEFSPKTDRAHRAEREQGSAGADHADRQGDRRRLRDDRPRRGARRIVVADLPRRGDDLDAVGRHRRRPDRHRASGDGRRGGKVRTAMSENVIEVTDLTKRYGRTTVVKGISFAVDAGRDLRTSRVRTARARPRPS